MDQKFRNTVRRSWNAFKNHSGFEMVPEPFSHSSYQKPDRIRLSAGNERSIINSVYNRIAMDASSINIRHVKLDDNGRFTSIVDSTLNRCLNDDANIDQTGRAFIQDVVMSLLDEGCVAIVPVDTDTNPDSGPYNILSLRTAKVVQWNPRTVKVKLYNDQNGMHEEIYMPKSRVAIIENPLYSVMNEKSSTLQRLIRKLNLLDAIDAQSGSGKLDLIVQVPYVTKDEIKRKRVADRKADLETQLKDSPYGVAYIDATEKITQLNRPVDNNLMKQIEYLTSMLYSQLGITQSILDGTADEKTMLNYYNRTIEPIIAAIVDELKRKFLTKTARSQRQTISYFRDPFRLVPVSEISEIADKFTRNEIMSSNEIRQIIGLTPSSDPKADELRNKNLNESSESIKEKKEPVSEEEMTP